MTGGAGFIGSNLVERLLAGGHEVVVVDDLSSGKKDNLAALPEQHNLKFVKKDVCDQLDAELGGVDDGMRY